jgi:hypothetical protein
VKEWELDVALRKCNFDLVGRLPKSPSRPYDALTAAMLTMSKILANTHGPEGIR